MPSRKKKLVRARLEQNPHESYQTAHRIVTRRGLLAPHLAEAGMPQDQIDKWDGELLALYMISGGLSAVPKIAQEQARENARLQNYALDIGHYSKSIPKEKGERLMELLRSNNVQFKHWSLAADYVKKKYRH